MWLVQIGLGYSETEHTGDEPGEMGEDLSVANLGGVCSSTSLFYACCLSACLPPIKPVPVLEFFTLVFYWVRQCISSWRMCLVYCGALARVTPRLRSTGSLYNSLLSLGSNFILCP